MAAAAAAIAADCAAFDACTSQRKISLASARTLETTSSVML